MEDYPQVCLCCIFLVVVYPVETAFSKSCPGIVVEVKEAGTTTQRNESHRNANDNTGRKGKVNSRYVNVSSVSVRRACVH